MESNLSEASLADNNVSVIKDISEVNSTLIVVFGGIACKLPIPVFEFMKSLDKYNVDKVFIRDFHQAWYQLGLKGLSTSVEETVIYLKKLLNSSYYKKVIFIGNSAGGFAAMLYGWLINVDEVHAFAPQTFTNKLNRYIYRDYRWLEQIKELHSKLPSSKYQDLKRIQKCIRKTKTHIYWDCNDRLDNNHTTRLKHNSITKLAFNKGGHNVIKLLKQDGQLDTILESILKND
ncbi:hypothetical protein [Carboxylicivirga marina]|uniref:Alpha/beta hydrolase n=1 Tax=Carboxylicivirga marina TaxID=2800988 RepID=A0ABS1HJ27_9BACT|nr:hypothetical protein [Carboxylicivirga marina]MBK3517683.1 hypothetical protein [Carboxylicivirga marina]